MTAIEELRRLLGKLPNQAEAMVLLDEVELERVAVPAGWRLVPAKCTGQMADAGAGVDRRLSVFKAADIYRAMLDAAPQPASQPQEAAQGHCYDPTTAPIPPLGHPLRTLGEFLSSQLDEDRWADAEQLLLAAWESARLPLSPAPNASGEGEKG